MIRDDASIRFFGACDKTALLAVLQAAFERWPAISCAVDPADHLEWKLSSPGADGTHLVAEASGAIVGCRLSIARRMKLGVREVSARFGTDTAVHPDWQQRGIMTRMREFGWAELARRFDLHSGSTSNEFVLRQDLRDGRRLYANQVEVLERDVLMETIPTPSHGLTISEAPAFDDRVDGLWQRASGAFEVTVVRGKDYLNWRFADPRSGRFTIAFAEDEVRLLGYIVVSTADEKGHIADLIVLPERADALEALLRFALARLSESDVRRAQLWCPRHHPYRTALEGLGFEMKRVMEGVTLGAYDRVLDKALGVLSDPNAPVHFMSGDTDLV